MRSTSRENLSIVMVEFDWGINMDYAAQEIRDRIDPVIEKLPDDARRQVLFLPMSTAISIVDWLVEGAYAERLSDPDDRRVVKVAPADTGREMYKALYGFAARQTPRILEQLSEKERAHFIALIHKFARILSEEMR